MSQIIFNIARVFDTRGKVIGTGCILAGGWFLTCAHVATDAIKGKAGQPYTEFVEGRLSFEVPRSGDNLGADGESGWVRYEAETDPRGWGPKLEHHAMGAGDFALLKIVGEDVQGGLYPPPDPIRELGYTDFWTHGYPIGSEATGRDVNLKFPGNMYGRSDGLIIVSAAREYMEQFISPGHSGAPVFGKGGGSSVCGIVKAVKEKQSENIAEAAVVPSATIHWHYQKLLAPKSEQTNMRSSLQSSISEGKRPAAREKINEYYVAPSDMSTNSESLRMLKDLREILREKPSSQFVVDLRSCHKLSTEIALSLRCELDQALSISGGSLVHWLIPNSPSINRVLSAVGFHWVASIYPGCRMSVHAKLLSNSSFIGLGVGAPSMDSEERGSKTNFDQFFQKFYKCFKSPQGLRRLVQSEREFKRLEVPILSAASEIIYNSFTHAYDIEVISTFGKKFERRFDFWIGLIGYNNKGQLVTSDASRIVLMGLDQGLSIPSSLRRSLEYGGLSITYPEEHQDAVRHTAETFSDLDLMSALLQGRLHRRGRYALQTGLREILRDDTSSGVRLLSGNSILNHSSLEGNHTMESRSVETGFCGTLISIDYPVRP